MARQYRLTRPWSTLLRGKDGCYSAAMPTNGRATTADRSQRRASYQQARSRETKRILLQAAMALWCTNGYANTTVADICTAAGVSKALFYFYFPRKEDVPSVIAAALASLERSMARNPPELIIQTILEGYRHEHRILAAEESADEGVAMFTELFARAQRDGKLAAHIDVEHLAYVAGTLVSEGARHWAAGSFGDRSFADVVGDDIAAVIAGYTQKEA